MTNAWLKEHGELEPQRHRQAEFWLIETLLERFGSEGLKWLRRADPKGLELDPEESPFTVLASLVGKLNARLGDR